MRRSIAVLLLALGAACAAPDPRPDVEAWLSCEECLAGELDAVVAHGDNALDALFVILYRGASAPHQRNYHAQVNEEYRLARRASSIVAGTSQLSDSAAFITDAIGTLLTGRRTRAAWAIRAIDTPLARSRLHDAAVYDSAGVTTWAAPVSQLVKLLDSPAPVTSVSIISRVSTLAVGDSTQLRVEVRGPVGVSQDVTWTSFALHGQYGATVSSAGLAKRVSPMPARVRACSVVNPSVCASAVFGLP